MAKLGAMVVGLMAMYQTTMGQTTNYAPPISAPQNNVYNPVNSDFALICHDERYNQITADSSVYGLRFAMHVKGDPNNLVFCERFITRGGNGTETVFEWVDFSEEDAAAKQALFTKFREQTQNFAPTTLSTGTSCANVFKPAEEKPQKNPIIHKTKNYPLPNPVYFGYKGFHQRKMGP